MSRVVSTGLTGPSGSLEPEISSRPARSSGPSCFTALCGLSDRELLSRVKALVSKERATTLDILVHLIEVERRKLHLSLGYPSMFEYSIRHLGYSSSAAGRRIHAARCVRDFPGVYGLLEKNEVTLITVSLVASILNESNARDLIAKIHGKSQREVEAVVATYRPPVSMRDRAKPVCVAVTEPVVKKPVNSGHRCPLTPSAGSEISPNVAGDGVAGQPRPGAEKRALRAPGENAPNAVDDRSAVDDLHGRHSAMSNPAAHGDPSAIDDLQGRHSATSNPPALRDPSAIGDALGRSSATCDPTAPSHDPTTFGAGALTDSPVPRIERKLLIQFLAREAFMKKFEKARALLSNKIGRPSYEFVLETALDEFLAHHDPDKRGQRREDRKNEADSEAMLRNRAGQRSAGPGGGTPEEQQKAPGRSCHTTATPGRGRRTPIGPLERSRHIPAATRDAVFKRDKGRCTYVGSAGKRCDATHNLQIDHVVPYARGGSNTVENLRLLCSRHNKLEAERVYGANATRRCRTRE